MKIWIDLANSPQVLFFRPLISEFCSRGHSVQITTRAYAQTVALADRLNLVHTTIGDHGGPSIIELMSQNFLRSIRLRRWAIQRDFDLAISHNSYSQALAARLLTIPVVTLMDYEHQPLNHLCFRLADRVIVPEAFPPSLLRRFGAGGKSKTYPGLKEQVYLADFIPDPEFRRQHGFPVNNPFVVVRPPAPWTAYHRFENDLFDGLLARLTQKDDAFILFLPRLQAQAESVRGLRNLHIADQVYDGPNLLYNADLVVSGGGTMNREAAVLGTPVYTIFKGRLGAVDRYLIERGQMRHLQSKDDLDSVSIEQSKHKDARQDMPNLIPYIADLIL